MLHRNSDSKKEGRGFASMAAERQREIARKGGKAAHAQGRAHEFTADEARAAGRLGGETVSRDREHMAAIGRAGGRARGRLRAVKDGWVAEPAITPAE
jgi:general stress protein YciG